jgi:hypothetical protein
MALSVDHIDPATLYFTDKWILYANLQAGSVNYINSYVEVATIHTIADFWQVMNNVPYDKLHSDIIQSSGKRIIAFSLFKEGILPEWEDPVNHKGCEWGFRDDISNEMFCDMWLCLTLAAVNSEIDDVAGVRCVNKCNRLRPLYKIEVWLTTADYDKVYDIKNSIDRVLNTEYVFTLMFHEDKQQQAFEFRKKTRRHAKMKHSLIM